MDYPSAPPSGYQDPDQHDMVLEAAKQAAVVLPQLPMSTLKALMSLLSPATKKLRWYEGRYNAMLAKNQELTAEVAKLYERLRKLEERSR